MIESIYFYDVSTDDGFILDILNKHKINDLKCYVSDAGKLVLMDDKEPNNLLLVNEEVFDFIENEVFIKEEGTVDLLREDEQDRFYSLKDKYVTREAVPFTAKEEALLDSYLESQNAIYEITKSGTYKFSHPEGTIYFGNKEELINFLEYEKNERKDSLMTQYIENADIFPDEEALARLFGFMGAYMEKMLNENPTSLVTDESVFYMNGNDSTSFDWEYNDRMCEFGIFRSDEFYYLKATVNKRGEIKTYMYGNENPNEITGEFKGDIPYRIDLKSAVDTLISAEAKFECSPVTQDWDLTLFETLAKIDEVKSRKVGPPRKRR